MAVCLSLAWDFVPSHGSNMGVLGGEHKSKASLRCGLGCDNKRMLWYRHKECGITRTKECVGSTHNISQVRGHMGTQTWGALARETVAQLHVGVRASVQQYGACTRG